MRSDDLKNQKHDKNYEIEEIKNLGNVGKFRVRIIKINGKPGLDIREYIQDEKYTGYTRKGIYLGINYCEELLDILKESLTELKNIK